MSNVGSSMEFSKDNINILIVDDESTNLTLFEKILATYDYTNVTSTINPKEVALLQKENKFKLILLDINMPEMSGYEVLEELRNNGDFNDIQVIATSADILPENIKEALDAGFSDYITKPMRLHDFSNVIEKAINKIRCN